MNVTIRKATPADRESIHESHMRSIREVCINDHGSEEVRGWGHRPPGDRWIEGIESGLVWVVEWDGGVRGVAHIKISRDENTAHIQSLYLTQK